MKFTPMVCPECGALARGTLESLSGCAEFEFRKGGEVDHSGDIEVYPDSAITETSPDGRVRLVCRNGHDWPAVDESEEAASPAAGGRAR